MNSALFALMPNVPSKLGRVCSFQIYGGRRVVGYLANLGLNFSSFLPQHRPPQLHRSIHRGGNKERETLRGTCLVIFDFTIGAENNIVSYIPEKRHIPSYLCLPCTINLFPCSRYHSILTVRTSPSSLY
jgi:hypothetical protein